MFSVRAGYLSSFSLRHPDNFPKCCISCLARLAVFITRLPGCFVSHKHKLYWKNILIRLYVYVPDSFGKLNGSIFMWGLFLC